MHVQRPDEADGAHVLGGASLGLFAGETAGRLHFASAFVHFLRAGVRQSRVRIRHGFAWARDDAPVGHQAFRVGSGLCEKGCADSHRNTPIELTFAPKRLRRLRLVASGNSVASIWVPSCVYPTCASSSLS